MKLIFLLRKIKNNKDGESIVSNFFYLSLLQVAGYVFPILTLPYLAKIIGVEGFGKIAFASAVMVWIQTVADWGFNYTATRDVAKNRNNKEIVSEIFSNVLWARCLLMILSLIFLSLLILVIPKFRESADVLYVTFLLIPGHILFPDWFFQALERMKYITVLNLLSKLLFTIAVFVVIKRKEDYLLQPLLVSLGYVFSGIIAMYYIVLRWRYKLQRPSVSKAISAIKNSTDVFINNLMPNLYNSFSSVLLGFIGGDIANGKLDAGNKFSQLAQQFMQIVSRVFYPFLSRRIDKHGAFVKLNLSMALGISFVLFLMAPILIKFFFTEEFYDAIPVLRILSISIIFMALSNTYGTNYMIIEGYERQLRNITAMSSIIGLLISFPLIYYFNFIGAALTICITRGILGLSITYKAYKIKRIKLGTL